jgi:hypothetical protein
MYVVAEHTIKDAKPFWEKAQSEMDKLPKNLKLHQVLPNNDGSKAVCLWESGNVEDVKSYVDGMLGKWSSNLYFSVQATNAVGLPSK